MTRYALENKDEFRRLEEQSSTPEFDCASELKKFTFPDNCKILDAGSGSGIASRYLAISCPKSNVVGYELSDQRVEESKNASKEIHNLKFLQGDLASLPFEKNTFDRILSRYVFHHLSQHCIEQTLQGFLHCLKPGGKVCLIDVDGLFLNIYPTTLLLRKCLSTLENGPVDLRVGKKLKTYLIRNGFENIKVEAEALVFSGDGLTREIKMSKERIEHAMPLLEKIFDKETARKF